MPFHISRLFLKGYLTKDQSGETAHNLEKNLKFDDEKLMKCLEDLDRMVRNFFAFFSKCHMCF